MGYIFDKINFIFRGNFTCRFPLFKKMRLCEHVKVRVYCTELGEAGKGPRSLLPAGRQWQGESTVAPGPATSLHPEETRRTGLSWPHLASASCSSVSRSESRTFMCRRILYKHSHVCRNTHTLQTPDPLHSCLCEPGARWPPEASLEPDM